MIRGQQKIPAEAAFDILFHDKMLQYRSVMPGVIQALNYESGKLISVNVQPAIGLLTSEDGRVVEKKPMPVIQGCPLILPYAPSAGLSLTLPLSVGDNCLLLCADRSIDDWQLEGGLQYPIEPTLPRTRDLTDAVCLPCAINNKNAIENYSSTAMELRNKDGTTAVSVTEDTVTVTQGTKSITLSGTAIALNNGTATLTLTPTALISSVPIEAPGYSGTSGGESSFTSDINMNGNNINGAADVVAGGVNLTTHTHNAPSGGGQTGGPE